MPSTTIGATTVTDHRGVQFARELRAFGDSPAILGADGPVLSYRELADRVDAAAAQLGTRQRLVLIAMTPTVDALATYLAALGHGHPAILAPAGDPAMIERLRSAYSPDVLCSPRREHWSITHLTRSPNHELHPDLALLLSTSGSTGSPKLVRLSAAGVTANAEAIADYLGIRPTDRAVASLPLHYCYGLSIVNSNLARGAALVLTDQSVAEPGFWQMVRAVRATSLHGVPHTFDLLDRAGFDSTDAPDLRYITQAGGRLAPERVRHYARMGAGNGWRFFVMYGQTEATARMAYLPPELAEQHPECVGIPIPGGRFRIDAGPGEASGELVYSGPNVMMGYAESPRDLARGRDIHELRTGDLATRTEQGLIRITGRASRFLKLYGLRVDLDHIEQQLAAPGAEIACTGDDTTLVVACSGSTSADAAREQLRSIITLPGSAIAVQEWQQLPRLASGKVDYPALRAACSGTPEGAPDASSVADLYRRVLRVDSVHDGQSFVDLGGDSLSYVSTSIGLERIIGTPPRGWPTMSVTELEAQAKRPSRYLQMVETNVVLRALAIIAIAGSHIGAFSIVGGAHILLVIAGWSFARFVLADAAESPAGRIMRSATRIAIPTMLWLLLARVPFAGDVGITNVLLINNITLVSESWGYWFVEALVQLLLLLGIILAVPPVRALEARFPLGFPIVLLALALVAQFLVRDPASKFPEHEMHTLGVAWFFLLGWVAFRASRWWHTALVLAVAAAMLPGYFDYPGREIIVALGILAVVLVHRLPVPRILVPALGLLASASLYIYVTHYAFYPELLRHGVPALVVLLICLAIGATLWVLSEVLHRRVGRAIALRRRDSEQGEQAHAEHQHQANDAPARAVEKPGEKAEQRR